MQRQQNHAQPEDGRIGYVEVDTAVACSFASSVSLCIILTVGKVDLGRFALLIPRGRIFQRPPAGVEYLNSNRLLSWRVRHSDGYEVEGLPVQG
jgi:hypothetical protein